MRKLIFAFYLPALAISSTELYNFSLFPLTGAVQGGPGSAVGWGYALQNQGNSFWLVTTDLNSDTILNATPTLLFDFPVLAPGASKPEGFDPASSTGLYQPPGMLQRHSGLSMPGRLLSARSSGAATFLSPRLGPCKYP
jgi:hypothetical protein